MAIYRGVGGSGDSATGEDVFGDNSSITSLNGISGAIQTPTYIKFDPNAAHTANQGELTWNTAEGTLDLGLNEGHVILQIGQETHYRITNLSGGVLPNGSLLTFSGTTGNSGKLLAELYDGTQPSKYIIGIATEDIPNGDNGYVTHFGKIRGIQTNGANYGEIWIDGDELYPSPTGGLTKVLPEAPNAKQPIAVVVNSHVSDGILFVRVGGHTSLEDDELVQLAGLTNNDILQWDGAQGRFENRSLANAGIQPLDAGLFSIAGLTTAADTMIYTTALDTYTTTPLSAYGRTLVDDADATTARTTLGLGTLATQSGIFSGVSSGTNTGDQNLFQTITIAGQSDVVADTTADTLTLVAGTGITLTTNAASDSITIDAAVGGVSDGDKGDITVTASGTTWTIDNGVVTPVKLSTGAPSWDVSSNTTVAGDLTLSGSAKRILGDFSNATPTNRLTFQTSTINGNTSISIMPNGTSTTSTLDLYTAPVTGNDSRLTVLATSTETSIRSSTNGAGTYLPMTFHTGASERMRIDTSGTVTLGTALPIASGGTGATTAATAFSNIKQAASDTATGVVELATNAEVVTGTDATRVVTPASMKAGLNASGTAPIYACRAWVNFNGTGTVAIRASGNVSSITDNGTGDYTINFTTALSDTNFAWSSGISNNAAAYCETFKETARSAGGLRIFNRAVDPGLSTTTDPSIATIIVFR